MEFVISHKTKVAQMSPDMKITQVKSNGKSLKNIELPDVMTAIRSGEQARVVNEHRGILSSSMPGDRNIHATDIPVLLFAARFRKKESRIEYQVYNGLVLMGVNSNFQSVVKGIILLLAVAIDCYEAKSKKKA